MIDRMHPDINMSIQEVETWTLVVPEIKAELAKQINFFVRSIFLQSLVKRQLQQMQSECTSLLNAMDTHTQLKDEMLELKNSVVDCLDSTLETIITTYERYADLSMNMSRMHFRAKVTTIRSNLVQTNKMMQALGMRVELKAVLHECFNKLISRKTASYESVDYISNLQIDLNQILSSYDKNLFESVLSDYLYKNHFNSELFIKFLINQHRLEFEAISDLDERQSRLVRMRGSLQKHKVTAKKPKYLVENNSIYDRMIWFFDTEIKCVAIAIKKAKPLFVPLMAPVAVPYCPVDYKLRFNFSVDCLAYFIKLLVNANVLDPGLKSELQKFVATYFQTPGTKSLGMSAGSFKTKYTNVTKSTSVTVRTVILAMLKLIDKEF
jgi:hypothetical protein